MTIRTDCRHFPGDRPCRYHKAGLAACSHCGYYAPKGISVLVVKLDALGDVLRTTSLLPSLKRKYGLSYITWVTSPEARGLFVGNDIVDEVMTYPSCLSSLLVREFDVVINPDAAMRSCELASITGGTARYGFVMNGQGTVIPMNAAARHWLEMGGCDALKRQNGKTYQEMLHEICELDPAGQRIVLELTDREKRARDDLVSETGLSQGLPVVGINTGAGGRWKQKSWRLDGFIELVDLLLEKSEAQVVLLGGAREEERNRQISARFTCRVHSPLTAGLRDLIRMVDICDVVVTGDTLALHVAAGLGKPVVAIFGPTSASEIDLYGLGTKIVPDLDCICCYRADCDRKPNCMDMVSAREIFEGVVDHLTRLESGESPGTEDLYCTEESLMVGEPGH